MTGTRFSKGRTDQNPPISPPDDPDLAAHFHYLQGRAGRAQVVTPVVQKNPSVMVWLPLSSVDKTSN